ncbi:hypothetical protein DFH07DRAFT_148165 [Mycena maculata]|uniref:Fanconi-associated nuclease n=1 Tax=Mycena maculata TaxID=230809 RepID=A0AAD7JVY8_9AGAR|nr:hypothetical protein DFH07DRAFT_148165 [Mycena maculata]
MDTPGPSARQHSSYFALLSFSVFFAEGYEMAKAAKEDIILTGFTRGPHSSGDKIDEASGETESEMDLNSSGDWHEPKICIQLLQMMITTVLDTESDRGLLTPREMVTLLSFQDLSFNAKQLFVYLVIHPKWHRLGSLKSVETPWGDVPSSIHELCRSISRPDCKPRVKPEPYIKTEEETVINLSSDVKEEEQVESKFQPKSEPVAGPSSLDDVKFVPDASMLFPFPRPEPAPSSLCITDLKMSLRELVEFMDVEELRAIAKELKLKPKKKPELIESILYTSKKQTTLASFFGKGKGKAGTETQEARLRAMIMKGMQKLVRVDPDVLDILRRVRILYSRSTQYPTEILARPLRHLQRKYPGYVHARGPIWPNREIFREYEDALWAEAVLDGILPSGILVYSEPVAEKDRKAAAVGRAKGTLKLFDEVYVRWVRHGALRLEGRATAGSEQFEPGYVLTRAVDKGAKAFKVLKRPDDELVVLDALLDQTYWGTGLRGSWHIRKTGILVDKMTEDADTFDTYALAASMKGLTDSDTGLVYRPTLIKSLAKLQKRAQTPPENQIDASTPNVSKIVFQAKKIPTDEKKKKFLRWERRNGESGSLETLVSQYYEEIGFKRVLPGGCVLTTLFTLLFWDILFAPVAGAFETHYQTGPLDLCEDTFFAARMDAITLRLSEIEGGKAAHYFKVHDGEHRGAAPCAVGVRCWDLCSRKDLIGVAKCIPRKTLATICQMFCEDYVGGCMAAPDLIAWDVDDKSYKLVHISAPGYPSCQSQKAWRDVLARGGADLEICEVTADGRRKTRKGKGKKKAADSDSDRESEDDELDPESEEEVGRSQSQVSKKRARDSDEDEDDESYHPKKSKKRKISGD